jgi:hypothetical protein
MNMLEPERRQLLLDALRPPPGFVFDRAVGTTFTLDLVALLVTPVAFALFDIEADDGRMAANPIAVLEAVRRHAGRITVFCQAGEIKVPSAFRAAYAYLESSVVAVRAPRAGGIFHPKVWVIRFASTDGLVRYRFLCLSRNLTFDRSWDTVLRLDGRPTDAPRDVSLPLAEFVRSLPRLAVASFAPSRADDLEKIAREVGTVEWEPLPDGLRLERLWPLGHVRREQWPFPERSWRRLIVSPFVGPDFVQRFTASGRGDMIVSRPETLDAIGIGPLAHLERRCVLRSDAVGDVDAQEMADDVPDRAGSSSDHPAETAELRGLHAKLFVVDDAWWSRIWTGSANATMQAFSRNVEFLVELRARNTTHGVLSLTNATPGPAVGFGRLLADYDPPSEPVRPSATEEAAQALDRVAMAVGGLTFSAEVSAFGDDRFRLALQASGRLDVVRADGRKAVRIAVRPVSLGAGSSLEPTRERDTLSAEWTVSFGALTAFFVVDLSAGSGSTAAATSFLVRAEVSGMPDDRLERVLAGEIRSRSDLLRLLLLLLGGLEPAFGDLVDVISNERLPASDRRDPVLGSDALLEPLMRTLSRNPARLDEIERLVTQLTKTAEGRALLPDGWLGLWGAVSAARAAGRAES